VAPLAVLGQRSAAAELDVVRVGADGQNIYFLHRVPLRFLKAGYGALRLPQGKIKVTTPLSKITFNYEMRESRESIRQD